MKKRKAPIQTYDLPESLLTLGEQEQNQTSNDVLHSLSKNNVSVQTKNLIKAWERVLDQHTQNWSEDQWRKISVEQIWEQVTSRIKPAEVVRIFSREYDGTISQYILQDDQLAHVNEWMTDEWVRAWHNQHEMNHEVPYKRDVLPVMLKALLNISALQMHKQATAIPFAEVCGNIIKEYNQSSEMLVQGHVASIFATLSQQNAHTLLKELHGKIPVKMMQRQWVKMGLKHAQMVWINKNWNKTKEGQSGAEILWEEIKAAAHTTPKHTQIMGDALFSKNSKEKIENYKDYQEKSLFQSAIKNLLGHVNPQEDHFQTWCQTPSNKLAHIVFDVVISETELFPFAKILINQCPPESRFEIIHKAAITPSLMDFLTVVPEHYIRQSLEQYLKDGQLQSVNTLMEKTGVQLTEDNWNTYWSWMESEHPVLGKGLRAIMEKNLMSAAIASHEQTSSSNQKRKI